MQMKRFHVLPNFLSVLRFPLGIVFAFMLSVQYSGKPFLTGKLLICFIAVAMTDLSDGCIARHFHCQSSFGAVLDVSADTFFILLALIVLNCYRLVPIWFTLVVVFKLADFILSSMLFSTGRTKHFIFDFPGKASVAGFYLLPICVVILPRPDIIQMTIRILTFSAVISSILRWISFVRQASKKSKIISP